MAQKALKPDRHGDFWWVDSRRLIEEEGFNRREEYGDIPALAREIKASGLNQLEPLTCYKKGENWVVIRGHRRCRALRILEQQGEILEVRIIPAPKSFKKEDTILDQITGNEGKPFTPWEQAKVLRDLRGLGWKLKDIQERSGRSLVYVRRLLTLADAPQNLINLVRDGRVSATQAMDSIAEETVQALIEVAEGKQKPLVGAAAESFSVSAPPAPSPPELFAGEPRLRFVPPQPAAEKITQRDIRPNPWKIFKKWAPTVEEEKLPPVKLEAWNLIIKIRDGEATEEDFKNFFG